MVLHGSGSDAAFVRSAFEVPLARQGLRLLAPEDRTGDPLAMAHRLGQLVRSRADITIVGGVSVGAHAVARWAAHDRSAAQIAGLLLVMPAWTGTRAAAAELTAHSAKALRRNGVHTELLRLGLDPEVARDWVMEELSRAWPQQVASLPDSLLQTAQSRGPLLSELSRIRIATGVVALDDDPLHPASVAEEWAARLRFARLTRVARHAPATDRSVFGAAAINALLRAQPLQGAHSA